MSEGKDIARSFAQVTLDREREIMTRTDEVLKKLCLLEVKIFGEKPANPSGDMNEKQEKSFQNDMSRLQKQIASTLEHINEVADNLNKEFDN